MTPEQITREQVKAALAALGIPTTGTVDVTITLDTVTIHRRARDNQGRPFSAWAKIGEGMLERADYPDSPLDPDTLVRQVVRITPSMTD